VAVVAVATGQVRQKVACAKLMVEQEKVAHARTAAMAAQAFPASATCLVKLVLNTAT
jgi:hypothetical protein